ncbi:hypothetical protein GOBAR_AA09351 [Gossypium barbadense]|uniref:Uncharacterized protein n=1 Tax=Gossypium barbadense TaxID=3634 RepID=A0A2P5Y6R3_GOSBA|nr:hypothetical protein GOBAR_AA09351 [Gossypium barbadense]
MVNDEYKPRVPYPNATRKDRSDEQFGKFLKLLKKIHINLPFIEALSQMPNAMKFLKELLVNKRKLDEASHVELNAVCSVILQNKLPHKLKYPGSFTIPCLIGELTLRVGDETITLQARNSGITLNIEGKSPNQSTKTDNMTLQKLSFKEVHEPCSRNDREHNYEERRLRIEELDEWRAHKPRTHDKSKLRQNKPDVSLNQLKVGDQVLLDAADLHIVTTTPNEKIFLTVLSIFPFGTVEVSHPKFGTFKVTNRVFEAQVPSSTRPITRPCLRPCDQYRGKHGHTIRPCKNRVNDFPKHGMR